MRATVFTFMELIFWKIHKSRNTNDHCYTKIFFPPSVKAKDMIINSRYKFSPIKCPSFKRVCSVGHERNRFSTGESEN